MNLKKAFHRELSRYSTPAMTATPVKTHASPRPVRGKRWLTAPVAIAMAVFLTIGAAAAGVTVIQRINRDIITENSTRLTEVPEGFTAIYTAADLVRMREEIESGTGTAGYILMADITFTDEDYAPGGICEGGWEPIDLRQHVYLKGTPDEDGQLRAERPEGFYSEAWKSGTDYIRFGTTQRLDTFHGNGHVIRNLKISAPATNDLHRNAYGYSEDLNLGLFGDIVYSPLEIINLGIEGCEITVTGEDILSLGGNIFIGGIAAQASYIGASYVKDLTVRVELDTLPYTTRNGNISTQSIRLLVGGIAGCATYLDACYAEDYAIDIRADGHPCVELTGGGIAARATATLTSWSQGHFDIRGDGFSDTAYDGIMPDTGNILFPTIMPADTFALLQERLAAAYGTDNFNYKKVCAYFLRKSLPECQDERQRAELKVVMDQWNEMYALARGAETDYYDTLYIFDPTAAGEERLDIQELMRGAFESEEAYRAFCSSHSLIVGKIHCHIFDGPSSLTRADFDAFDFNNLWTLQSGKPRLRVFS